MEKKCKECNILKNFDEFYISFKTIKGNTYKSYCKSCHKSKSKQYAQSNPHIISKINKKYNKNNKDKVKEYKIKNSDRIKLYNKEYYSNPQILENHKKQVVNNHKIRLQNDPSYKLHESLRHRLYSSLKNKYNSSKEYLGCPLDMYKQHIESQFYPEMDWSNWGKVWELDHIIGVCNFDLAIESEQKKAFHYSNLQPLFKTTEIAKSYGYFNIIGNRNKPKKITQ